MAEVTIGDGCVVGAHAVIHKLTTVGKDGKFFPGCSIGADPQDWEFSDEKTFTVIGDNSAHFVVYQLSVVAYIYIQSARLISSDINPYACDTFCLKSVF